MSHAGFSQRDELAGDAGFFHDVAAQDEKRDGQQHGFACGGGDQLGNGPKDHRHGTARAQDQHCQNTGDAQADRDGRAQEQQYGKDNEQYQCFHVYSSLPWIWSASSAFSMASATTSSCSISLPASRRTRFWPKRMVTNRAPMGTKEPNIHSGSWVPAVS